MMHGSRHKASVRTLRSVPWSVLFTFFLFAAVFLRPARAEIDPINPPGQLVDIGGYRLHIRCEGEGSPAVIMDAGLGGLSLEWLSVQRFLKHYTQVCSYDRAGYGWSDPGPQPRTSSMIADELFQLLLRASVRGPYILVGHSFGGYNVQLFAERYPYLTAGVVLVDSSHPDQVERFLAPPLSMNTAPTGQTSGVVLLPGPVMLPANMPEDAQTAALMLMSRRKSRQAAAEEFLYFRDSAAEVRAHGALPNVPLVVISRGIPERNTAEEQGRLAEALWITLQEELAERSSRSAHLIANESGHHVHLDQPQLVADAITMVLDFARAPAEAPARRDDLGSTWLAFAGATWRSDSLHRAPEEYLPLDPTTQVAAVLPVQLGHVAWTAQPDYQRVRYLRPVSLTQ